MSVNFDAQSAWQVGHCLSSDLSRQLGVEVWLIHQAEQDYCIKFLSSKASIDTQQTYQQELHFYQHTLNQSAFLDVALPAQVLSTFDILQQGYKGLDDVASDILIMPYAMTLDCLLSKPQSVTAQSRLHWFEAVLNRVHHLQQMGYLHGDLKPQHFVCYENQLKLIDFAQVQCIESNYGVQEKGGTPAYMAPELFLGQAKTIQTEIYALGIIFYQLLLGEKPFVASNYQQWALQHCQKVIPLLPESLQIYQNILDKMLAKRCENRFLDLSDIKSALNLIKISKNADNLFG